MSHQGRGAPMKGDELRALQERLDEAAQLLLTGQDLLRQSEQLLAESETQRDALVAALEPLGVVYWHGELESWVIDRPSGGCLHVRDVLRERLQRAASRVVPPNWHGPAEDY